MIKRTALLFAALAAAAALTGPAAAAASADSTALPCLKFVDPNGKVWVICPPVG